VPKSKSPAFRISRPALAGFCAVVAAIVYSAAWRRPEVAVPSAILAAGFYLILARLMTIRVDDDGVSLYGANWLPWVDIVAARRWSLLGLPYLIVSRRRGWSWWIPLYFRAEEDLEYALLEWAPPENPIRSALSPKSR
jgi:hypothetical protein